MLLLDAAFRVHVNNEYVPIHRNVSNNKGYVHTQNRNLISNTERQIVTGAQGWSGRAGYSGVTYDNFTTPAFIGSYGTWAFRYLT